MINIIAAVSKNNVIGKDNGLPWKMSADLKRFKEITMGHPIIMGRKTFESIGRVLPGRTNIVVTSQKDYKPEGTTIAHNLDEAVKIAQEEDEEIFLIGGARVFEEGIDIADKLYLNHVDTELDGDVYFPKFNINDWTVTSREAHKKDEKNEFDYEFVDYLRKFMC